MQLSNNQGGRLMTKYNQFVKAHPNRIDYQYWKDDKTIIRYTYDNKTFKGIEQVYKLADEYEIDKTEEIMQDLFGY